MLDAVVGEQRHPVVGAEPARVQERGDPPGERCNSTIRDGAAVVGRDDAGLVGMPRGRPRNPMTQQERPGLFVYAHCTVNPSAHYRRRRGQSNLAPAPAPGAEQNRAEHNGGAVGWGGLELMVQHVRAGAGWT